MPDAKMTEGERIADEKPSGRDAVFAWVLRGPSRRNILKADADDLASIIDAALAAKDAEIERLRDACTKVSAFALRKHGGWTVPAGAVTACDDAIGIRWQDGKLIDKEPTNDHHCQHNWVYDPDPSGNKDSSWHCYKCSAWSSKLPEGM